MLAPRFIPAFLICFFTSLIARADVVLTESPNWRTEFSGFAELDLTQDSRPSFLESAGNYPIQGPSTPAGDANSARREYSMRNSRLGFALVRPGKREWNPKFYIELDFLGNRASWRAGSSTTDYYNDPSLRFRHYYFSVEHGNWQVLAGQYWTLFGWGPSYFVTTASVLPGPGVIYQRTKQIGLKRQFAEGDHHLDLAFTLERGSQKAAGVPNLVGGTRYSYEGLRSGFASPSGEAKAEPLSLAVTGTLRQFGTGATNSKSEKFNKVAAAAMAVDTLIPIIPSSDGKNSNHTLTFTAESSGGTGYGDAFPGWSGNLQGFSYDETNSTPSLGEGFGGFDSRGEFQLFHLFSWNAQLQYHWQNSFITMGHAELSATNVRGLAPVDIGFKPYDHVEMNFLNLFHDFSDHVRMAVEWSRFATRYIDGSDLLSDRYQLSAFYRF